MQTTLLTFKKQPQEEPQRRREKEGLINVFLGDALKEFGVKVTLAFDKAKVEEAKKNVAELGREMKGVAISIAAASASLFAFANAASSNEQSATAKRRYAWVLNVERLQELEYAAKVAAGVSREELTGALTGVAETLDKVAHGDVMAGDAFKTIGVNVVDLVKNGATADTVFLKLVDALNRTNDPLAKLRLATSVGFSPKLIHLINKGSAWYRSNGRRGS